MKNYKNILYYNTDIFDIARSRILGQNDGCSILIPHVCNNINLFGAGFAAAVAREFPIVKQNFHLLGNQAKLGYVQYVTASKNKAYGHQLILANMIAQNRVVSHTNPRPLNYEALVKCMVDVRSYIHNFQKTNDTKVEIHSPKFGSGLAGGNWSFIEQLITDIWYDFPIFVYSYNPNKINVRN